MDATEETTPGSRRTRNVLVVVALAAFLVPFMSSALNLALPAIGAELALPAVVLNWVQGAYLVSSAALLLPFGRLGDLRGRRRVFLAGMLVHALASLASALASSAPVLLGCRLLQGAGGAMSFATGVAMLTGAAAREERGRVLGLSTAAVYVGLSVGPVLGGVLTQQLGWRSIFVAAALLSVATGLLARLAIPAERLEAGPGTGRPRVDAWGSTLYSASLASLIAGAFAARTMPAARWLVPAGGLGLVAFLLGQRTAASPILDLRVFRSPAFAFSNLAAFIHYAATFAVGFLLSLDLQVVRGLSPQAAGTILLAQPVLMALLSPLSGRLSDRVEPRIVASLGMAITSGGLLLLSRIEASTSPLVIGLDLALIGMGFGLFSSPNTNAVMSAVERERYGVASATLGTMRLVGQACSLAVVSILFSRFLGTSALGPGSGEALLASTRVAFLLFAGLCFLGVFASLARGDVRSPSDRLRA